MWRSHKELMREHLNLNLNQATRSPEVRPLLASARVKNGLLLQDKGAQRSSARWEFNPQNTQKKPPSGTMKQRLSKSS